MTYSTDPVEQPDTMSDAVRLLQGEGFAGDVAVRDGGVHCRTCDTTSDAAAVDLDRAYRFEGTSDPADETIVLGLVCPACDARGVLASAYGPTAEPAEVEVLQRLVDRRED